VSYLLPLDIQLRAYQFHKCHLNGFLIHAYDLGNFQASDIDLNLGQNRWKSLIAPSAKAAETD
jgi:hypothetical protein